MQDNEVKQNIQKCSRCGLCQGVCPIYKTLKSEQSTARGKLMQILGLKKGELKFNKKILMSLDLCLNCEKCKLNCPSGVDTTGVFCTERKLGPLGRFLTSDFVFDAKLSALSFFSIFKKTPKYSNNSKILYFEGCISKKLKNQFTIPGLTSGNGSFKCCGLPHLTKGRLDIYNKIVRYNEKIIEQADIVIFDCATCLSAVRDYPFKNPKNKEKLVFYTDYYKNLKFTAKKPISVSYHMPCHLKSSGIELKEIENIFKDTKNLTYKPLKNPEDCCGFGGDFFIRHPFIAYTISMKKAENIINSKVDAVLTSCPTCLWSLKFSLFIYSLQHGIKTPRAYDMAQFYTKYCDTASLRDKLKEDSKKELIKV